MESWELPEEITSDILSRLSVKSVMLCRSVCKFWRVLLHTPYFINMHLTRSSQFNNPSLLFSTIKSTEINVGEGFLPCTKLYHHMYLIEHMVELLGVIDPPLARLQLPQYYPPRQFRLDASCNGLLLLSDPYDTINVCMLVCNPFTLEKLELPQSNIAFMKSHDFFGFGYHSTTKEYKVLCLSPVVYPDSSYKLMAAVHTLGSPLWRSKGDLPFSISWDAFIVHVNGVLYWLARYPIGSHNVVISSFDIADEEFRFFPGPSQSHLDGNHFHIKLQELRGTLCLVDYSTRNHVDIWVMKHYAVEESWTKIFVVPVMGIMESVSLIWQMEGGDIILEHNQNIISYDPNNNQLTQLEVQVPRRLRCPFVHEGSLVSPMQTL